MSRSISLLLAGSLFLALLALVPAQAGSQEDPEITDGDHDLSLAGTVPGCADTGLPQLPAVCTGEVGEATFAEGHGGDVVAAWIDHENLTSFQINIQTHDDPAAFMEDPAEASGVVAAIRLTASVTVNGLVKEATALYSSADGVPTVGGVATSVAHDGAITSLVIPRLAFGNITAGTQLTNFTVLGESLGLGPDSPQAPPQAPASATGAAPVFTDMAPNDGVGAPYNFTFSSTVTSGEGGGNGGAPGCTYRSGEANRTDADADCLPDHWEQQHFGGTAGQTGLGDPDGDGCSNRCEYLNGTDPKKADSDGDGTNDGDEVDAGTNPTNPASHPGAPGGGGGTTTTAAPGGGTTTTRAGQGTTTSRTGSATGTGASTTTGSSVLDKVQADASYAVASGAAMGVVVLVSLIGLFGRWGL